MNQEIKKKRIDNLFKILCLKEDLDKDMITNKSFKTYILNQYNDFTGYDDMDKMLQEKIVVKLHGLYRICDELSKDEIKSIIFKMNNLIARSE